jgi:hypothetical protein
MIATTRRVWNWRLTEAASLAAAVCLASCAIAPEPIEGPPTEAATPAQPPSASLPAPPRPARKPSAPILAAPVEPAEPAPPPAPINPERLIGLGEVDAENWLGQPEQRSEAPPATIWRYASRDCEIDVYFYLDLQHRVMRALHYEVRSNDVVERRPERCFQQLVDEHREREGSSTSHRPR